MLRVVFLAILFSSLPLSSVLAQDDSKPEDEKLSPTLEKLVKQFKNFDPRRRIEALEMLAKLGPEGRAATPAVLDLLTTAKLSPKLQSAGLAALEKINPAVYKPMLTLLLDESIENREEALKQIAELPMQELAAFYPVIIRSYQAERVRSNAESGMLPRYLQFLADHFPDKPEVPQLFLQAITFAGPNARGSAARAKAVELSPKLTLDRKQFYKALVSGLNDEDPDARAEVIKALASYKGEAKAILPLLKRLKFDKNQSVREAASLAVFLIEGEN
jgi:hypothetical protein